MQLTINSAVLRLKIADITKEKVDAVVNAANSSLMGGGGVDGAIHRAGGPAIPQECKQIIKKIGRLETGKAVITTAGNMPSKFVIHTVGPVWQDGNRNEAELLYSAYYNSLKLAKENELKSISFPSISTGAYRFPVNKASEIALSAIKEFLEAEDYLQEVNLVLFSEDTYESFKNAIKI